MIVPLQQPPDRKSPPSNLDERKQSEFAKQALIRIVEQARGSRGIYEYETVFELASDFCANCIRASLLAGPG
jgi:hypothetical protein